MSIHDLAPGTDILRARAAEMAHHAHGRLSRDPAQVYATLHDLVTRAAALGVGDIPMPAGRSGEVHLSADWPWRTMSALAPGFADPAAPGVLDAIKVQVEVDGAMHRHHEAFFEALETLVGRVLAAEERAAAPTPTMKATAP